MIQDRWNHASAKAPQALAKLPKKSNGDVSWGTIRVAHLDTGFRRHAAFGAWSASGANDIVETPGRDFFQPSRPSAEDPLTEVLPPQQPGHGTRTAAVLSGRSASGDFLGIAPGLPITPYRVNQDSLIMADSCRAIARALALVVTEKRCSVVNISLGFPVVLDQDMGQAVDRAYEAGVIICAAAGQPLDKVVYPAKHRRVIGVAGYRKSGTIYQRYDRYGRIDAWAPANGITRPKAKTAAGYSQNGDGTSYATLHVAAAAAIWLRFHGAAIHQKYGATWKRVEAFRLALHLSQRPLPFPTPPASFPGNEAGRLDIANLLAVSLPDANMLVKETDLAGDDSV
jgi:subtilisin family serine protease